MTRTNARYVLEFAAMLAYACIHAFIACKRLKSRLNLSGKTVLQSFSLIGEFVCLLSQLVEQYNFLAGFVDYQTNLPFLLTVKTYDGFCGLSYKLTGFVDYETDLPSCLIVQQPYRFTVMATSGLGVSKLKIHAIATSDLTSVKPVISCWSSSSLGASKIQVYLRLKHELTEVKPQVYLRQKQV